jgi:hypothetical protein
MQVGAESAGKFPANQGLLYGECLLCGPKQALALLYYRTMPALAASSFFAKYCPHNAACSLVGAGCCTVGMSVTTASHRGDSDVEIVEHPVANVMQSLPICSVSACATQRVSTLLDRKIVIEWMLKESGGNDGEHKIISKVVNAFPRLFHAVSATSTKAATPKVSRRWKSRNRFLTTSTAPRTLSRAGRQGRPRHATKVVSGGRGRKRAAWVVALYEDLLSEFHRMRRAGVKMNACTLRMMCLELLREGKPNSYGTSMMDLVSKKPVANLITSGWIQRFPDCHVLTVRRQSGKLVASAEKEAEV